MTSNCGVARGGGVAGALGGLSTFDHWKQRATHLRQVGIPQGSEDPTREALGLPFHLVVTGGGCSLVLGVAGVPLSAGSSAPAPSG